MQGVRQDPSCQLSYAPVVTSQDAVLDECYGSVLDSGFLWLLQFLLLVTAQLWLNANFYSLASPAAATTARAEDKVSATNNLAQILVLV